MGLRFVFAFFLFCAELLAPATSRAADLDFEVFDLRPVGVERMHITLTGPIVPGDAARLKKLIADHRPARVREFVFHFDSPGGNLFEGLAIGTLIAEIPEITVAQVGTYEAPNAVCASACVLSFLGADYRYLAEQGRIGVHRFGSPGSDMEGEAALSLAQELSAVLSEYIRAQRADPALYERMARTSFESIEWIERGQLEEWRVVTGPIYDEKAEYLNVAGSVALRLSQMSIYGDNSVTLICGDRGIVGVALLNKPELAMYGRVELAVDGGSLAIESFDILDDNDAFVRLAFNLPPTLAPAIARAESFGVRMVTPGEIVFFGFEMRLRDDKLKEMVETCRPGDVDLMHQSLSPIPGLDYPGGDMLPSGIRDISLDACLQVCRAEASCRAISYVTASRWCWPKSHLGTATPKPGVISAVK